MISPLLEEEPENFENQTAKTTPRLEALLLSDEGRTPSKFSASFDHLLDRAPKCADETVNGYMHALTDTNRHRNANVFEPDANVGFSEGDRNPTLIDHTGLEPQQSPASTNVPASQPDALRTIHGGPPLVKHAASFRSPSLTRTSGPVFFTSPDSQNNPTLGEISSVIHKTVRHLGAPDQDHFQHWGDTPSCTSPVSSTQDAVQCQHRTAPRVSYGPTYPDGSKHYSRLDSLSSAVSISGPFTQFSRDLMPSSPGIHASVVELPGYPRSGESVTSQTTYLSGSTLSFHHISYEVKLKKMPWSRPVTKTVLNDVSGLLRPGLNAIMGPTGSGKSSLLDVLAGRKDPRFLSGQVLVDGVPQPKNFKCISGYVVQDDIVMGTLTVRENLHFSAALRMTVRCSKAERRRKVDEIIEELGLTSVADSKIGTDLIRGVSGGERKRTNIGMELITDPPVLFLDEPTTGLDAFMAGQVIKTLKNLSRRGRTIIFSIHQPKYSIYKLFDSLTMVFRGRLVYHGRAKYAPIEYFLKLGYVCENHNNPSDFFMDILHGEAPHRPTGGPDSDTPLDEPEHIHLVGERLVKEWDESAEYELILKEVAAIAKRLHPDGAGPPGNGKSAITTDVSYAVPFCRQLNQVCWRTSLNLLRDPLASVVQTLVYLFFALSMGTVYFQMDTSLESGIQNRAGLFFFSTLQVVFVNLGSIELFIKERVLFIHENSSGYYRISAYFLSKILCDILPTKVLPVLLFMPICYWMAGLLPEVGAFFYFELLLSITTLAAAAIALFMSATFTLFGIANVVVSILFVFMMVFGGYLINLKSMAAWLSWLRYLSIFRYSMGGLLTAEMRILTFCPVTNTSVPGAPDNRQCQSGTLYLRDQDLPYATAWDLWSNVFGQVLIMIFFYILCYVQLRRINKYK
ncbi:ATP-binding cassette sub- G member 2 [Clonorchis sinensis]|uniref:ATP-binding cassette sub- G member 2 n=1 Tax=Clonorchis sinensis TaxID=79923 RepID=A0A8T1MAR5_CLOSI|nr:ATP-binding cassette sub- G member 2 [Clonorchis sinensis]